MNNGSKNNGFINGIIGFTVKNGFVDGFMKGMIGFMNDLIGFTKGLIGIIGFH